jgi:O-antigen/teichoic acid export membrane protein
MPLIGVILGFNLVGIVVLLTVVRIATLIAWLWLCFLSLPSLRNSIKVDRKIVKTLLAYGGWVSVSNVISPILVYFERFVIATVMSVGAVTYYSAPYEAVMRFGMLPSSMVISLFPSFSAIGSGCSETVGFLYYRSLKYLLLAMGITCAVLFLYSNDLISIWLGKEFVTKSVPIFQIFALGLLVNSLANIPFSYLQGIGRADIAAKCHVVELFVYIPLAWLLISKWGLCGAAAAWVARALLDMILLLATSSHIGKIGLPAVLRRDIVRSFAVVLIFVVSGFIIKNHLAFGNIGLAVLFIGLISAAWFWTLDQSERIWITTNLYDTVRRKF